MMRGGIPFSNAAGHRLRVLELRLRDPRPHRRRASRACRTTTTSPSNILKPLGMTSTTLEPSKCRADAARAGLPLGRRAVEGRAAAAAMASFGAMGGMLTSIRDLGALRRGLPRRVAAARWRRDRPGPARVVARDAAGRGARRRASRSATSRSARAAERRRLRLRPGHHADLRSSRTSSRTAAGCPDSGR